LIFVIEHLEPEIGKWLYIEYAHASSIVGRDKIIFTNIRDQRSLEILSNLGSVRRESFAEIFSPKEIIILDPKAPERLEPEDLLGKTAIIVGGILGDNPPRGRTYKLITSRMPEALARNIGRGQFSIDGAVYVAKLVSEGIRLENIPVRRGLRIRLNNKAEIYLPYWYPIRDGKPVVSEDLIKYLKSDEIIEDEERILRGEGET